MFHVLSFTAILLDRYNYIRHDCHKIGLNFLLMDYIEGFTIITL